jgi:hypothetical protein
VEVVGEADAVAARVVVGEFDRPPEAASSLIRFARDDERLRAGAAGQYKPSTDACGESAAGEDAATSANGGARPHRFSAS